MSIDLSNITPEATVPAYIPEKTSYIQEESLTIFMASLGYEPVYGDFATHHGLKRFTQPRFHKTGEINVSVNRAIKLHNDAGEEAFAELIAFTPAIELRDYLRSFHNYRTLVTAGAGANKIIEQVKASWSHKRGFQVHDHNVKFMSSRDKRAYVNVIGF